MKLFIFILLLGVGGYFGYDYLRENYLLYPAELNVRNDAGQELRIRLLARDETHLEFERLSDGKFFSYPVAKLDGFSRLKLKCFPVRELPPDPSPATAPTLAEMHREGMVKKLADLRAAYDLQMSKARSLPSCPERRALVSQIREIFYKIRKMEYDLEAFDARQGAVPGA